MRTLLIGIKNQLQADLDYVRNDDFFITEDENLVPQTCKFPAVGLKDGPVNRTELSGGMWEVTLSVRVVIYVQLHKKRAAIIGDASADRKGVLEISEDIHDSLDQNLLGIEGMQHAFSPTETESELVGDEKTALQRKIITYQYVKEEERASQSR